MPKLPKQAITASIILFAASLCALALFLLKPSPEHKEIPKTIIAVDTAIAEPQTLSINVYSQGTAQARTKTTLAAEVTGKITWISPAFESGTEVEAGEELVRIDDRNYRAALKRAESAVASAQSNLLQMQGQAAVARDDMARYPRKHTTEEGRALALKLPQLNEAKARLDAAEADLAQAQTDLERTRIRAPYRGIIRSRSANPGQFVATGNALGEIFAIDVAEVRLPIPLDRLPYLELPNSQHPDRRPAVTLSNDLGQQWFGHIVRSEAALDERSRVLFVVAQVSSPYRAEDHGAILLNGSFVKAEIQGRAIDNLVVVPRHVLRTGNQLWVIDSDNRLSSRRISALRTEGDYVYIDAGIAPGERICLSPVPNAADGTSIRVNSTISTAELLSTPGADTLAAAPGEQSAP
ncbi:efflux RND transporter periplasmic adaptor subunit [Spongiibacter sp. KMU-166]|uniref:Efflux RND transporter periplasmic adaptor subunit n=1 Tax=Spongiibacter thalassae TaxID=2721624 RepID=A0ABX1GBF0_9GAMM|nr:efflux RND transporter periplasmic adaptor subunit [Spongiibacter thalassae]NKI16271.1 efflux RND transporter periplasmic adaptor subunit [Spongiibacter thalassae]